MCADNCGIFAPIYKVRLHDDNDKQQLTSTTNSSTAMKRTGGDHQLAQSAMAALDADDEMIDDVYPHLDDNDVNSSTVSSTSLIDCLFFYFGLSDFIDNIQTISHLTEYVLLIDLFSLRFSNLPISHGVSRHRCSSLRRHNEPIVEFVCQHFAFNDSTLF